MKKGRVVKGYRVEPLSQVAPEPGECTWIFTDKMDVYPVLFDVLGDSCNLLEIKGIVIPGHEQLGDYEIEAHEDDKGSFDTAVIVPQVEVEVLSIKVLGKIMATIDRSGMDFTERVLFGFVKI